MRDYSTHSMYKLIFNPQALHHNDPGVKIYAVNYLKAFAYSPQIKSQNPPHSQRFVFSYDMRDFCVKIAFVFTFSNICSFLGNVGLGT